MWTWIYFYFFYALLTYPGQTSHEIITAPQILHFTVCSLFLWILHWKSTYWHNWTSAQEIACRSVAEILKIKCKSKWGLMSADPSKLKVYITFTWVLAWTYIRLISHNRCRKTPFFPPFVHIFLHSLYTHPNCKLLSLWPWIATVAWQKVSMWLKPWGQDIQEYRIQLLKYLYIHINYF